MTSKQALIYFIADLHLAENRPDITACFLSFLENKAPQASTLYILGDLFETWIGDDNHSPFNLTIAAAIKKLSDTGTKIYFIQGNRDFLLKEKYCAMCGMTLLGDVEQIDLFGRSAVIMHGDTLCTRDEGYQAFRKKSRSWWWQAIMTNLPLFLRRKIADDYRKKSANETAMKSQDIMDVTPSEVVDCLRQYDCQLMIHGHTHRPDTHQLSANGKPATRIVLGDWYEQGSWLRVTESDIELLSSPLQP